MTLQHNESDIMSYIDKTESESTKSLSRQQTKSRCDIKYENDHKVPGSHHKTCEDSGNNVGDQEPVMSDRSKASKKTSHHDNPSLELHRTDQIEQSGTIFLPRLTGTSIRGFQYVKLAIGNENQDYRTNEGNGDPFRLPDIHVECRKSTRLALQRSITDLLDPEMEILNKIKRGPRKKRKKRKLQPNTNDSILDSAL